MMQKKGRVNMIKAWKLKLEYGITSVNKKEYELSHKIDKVDACGLSETKKTDSGEQKITQRHILYYSGVSRGGRTN